MTDDFYDTSDASIIAQDTNQPFAQRSISFFFSIIAFGLIIFFAAGFYHWYTYDEKENVQTEQEIELTSGGEVPLPLEADRREEGFFESFFDKVGRSMQLTLNTQSSTVNASSAQDGVAATPMVNVSKFVDKEPVKTQETEKKANIEKHLNFTLADIVGKDVTDRDGREAGFLHDVVINKTSGEGMAIIIQEDKYFNADLSLLEISEVETDDNASKVQTHITQESVQNREEFFYDMLDGGEYISLKQLENAKVIDFEGNVTGEVATVIYKDSEVQSLYFTLSPKFEKFDDKMAHALPYDAVNIVEGKNRYEIRLSKEQTEEIAKSLFAK